ncbi:MAG: TonB-dependent receptor [Gemmatimonadota bacterium]|nr:TonB-dependent receptor [Gemmatimonadota bacterium]
MSPRAVFSALFVFACLSLSARAAMAQEGEIRGGVVDAAGVPLPGASVTLSGEGPGATREALADDRGRFVFTRVAPGTYALGVSLDGFRPVTVEGIALAGEPVVRLGAITLHALFLVDPVVVTATRFVEPLGRVPMSITAVGGVDLERRAIGTLTELARWAAGLTVVDQGARGSNVVIARGLHTDALTGSEQAGNNYNNGVATYLGDIPLAIDLRLRDIERVEVLLGPQGTLYGAGTLAGAVRYLPRRPRTVRRTLELRGDLFGLAHSDGAGSDAGLTLNLPLVPGRLAVRGSLDRYSDPGFIDYDYLLRTPGVSEPEPSPSGPQAASAHLTSEPDANTETTVSARLSLLWQPTPTLGALLAYHLQDQSVGARQVNHARSFGTGRYVAAHRYLEPNERRNQLWSLELSWAPTGADVTAAVGYSRFGAEGQRDQTDLLIQEFGIAGLLPGDFPALARARAADPDVSATDVTSAFRAFSAYTRESSTEERLNLETRVASRSAGPWRWVGGVFFNRYESRSTSHEFTPGLTEFSGVTPVLDGSPVAEPIEYYSLGTGLVEERAVFGEISRDLGEGWRLTAGGRGFSYRIETGNLTEFPYTPLYNSPFTDYASDDRGMLFKASVSYRVGEETTAYVTRSGGYRIGGSNNFRVCTEEEIALLADADPTNDPPQSGCIYPDQVLVQPDITTNYEVGVRRSWAGGRFRASATLFHVDWTDIQVAGLTPFSAQPITLNGAGAVSRGIELVGAAAPAGGLRLRGSWSYTRAELSQDSPGLLEGGADAFRGDRLSGAPQHQGNVLASWARPLGASSALEVLYGYTYVGDVLTRVGLRAGGERLSAYELHNASVSVSRGTWTLALYAENLLNEYAVTGVRQTPGQIGLTRDGFRSRRYFHNVLTPRRIGVRVGYAFGDD